MRLLHGLTGSALYMCRSFKATCDARCDCYMGGLCCSCDIAYLVRCDYYTSGRVLPSGYVASLRHLDATSVPYCSCRGPFFNISMCPYIHLIPFASKEISLGFRRSVLVILLLKPAPWNHAAPQGDARSYKID